MKLVGPFVATRATKTRARRIARWVESPEGWQRRAGAVAFVDLAPLGDAVFPGFVDLLLRIAEVNAGDPTRWSQTSVGWLMRELSHAEPERVRAFVDEHPDLAAEARRAATAKLAR